MLAAFRPDGIFSSWEAHRVFVPPCEREADAEPCEGTLTFDAAPIRTGVGEAAMAGSPHHTGADIAGGAEGEAGAEAHRNVALVPHQLR